ncbi:MAG TPA: YdcF family protein [Mariprofundaceae bacterium]|nr:YdcF family protein [Mariprofundaceae bacterium]
MLLAGKAISQLMLPPGGLILLGLAGLIFWRRAWGRWLVAASLLLTWLLSTEPVRDALVHPLESEYPPLAADRLLSGNLAIALLGGGLYEKAPEYGGQDALGKYALMRTLYAADLSRHTGLPVYPSGGVVLSDTSEPEGLVMRRWLIRFGVPESLIHAESAADNTWQNASLLKAMLAHAGISRVVLVTSAIHMRRSVWVFRRQGLEVIPAPCAYLEEREPYDLRSFLPRWNVLADSGDALHEYLGLVWYRLRYGAT